MMMKTCNLNAVWSNTNIKMYVMVALIFNNYVIYCFRYIIIGANELIICDPVSHIDVFYH